MYSSKERSEFLLRMQRSSPQVRSLVQLQQRNARMQQRVKTTISVAQISYGLSCCHSLSTADARVYNWALRNTSARALKPASIEVNLVGNNVVICTLNKRATTAVVCSVPDCQLARAASSL